MSPASRPEGEYRRAMHEGTPSTENPVQRKGSFLATMKAVGWSFFGVRKGSDYAKDVARLNPVHVVIAGVIGAALFVLVLVLFVNWVVSTGAAK